MKKLTDYEFQIENIEHSLKPKKRNKAVILFVIFYTLLLILKILEK